MTDEQIRRRIIERRRIEKQKDAWCKLMLAVAVMITPALFAVGCC